MKSPAKIAWVPIASDDRIASVRLRCLIPSRYLEEAGWECVVSSAQQVDDYDLVIFQKAYDLDSLRAAERLKRHGKKVVFDLCDNYLYEPVDEAEPSPQTKRLQEMLQIADVVSVSTPTLASFIGGAAPVVIDDALDVRNVSKATDFYARWQNRRLRRHPIRLVWFGNAGSTNPSFGLRHIQKIMPELEAAYLERPFGLTVISNSRTLFENILGDVSFPTLFIPWRRATFQQTFMLHDICLIPIEINPFTICKTGNRVAQSLDLNIPVIADPIPSFEEFSEFVLLNNWGENLRRYMSDPGLRERHSSEGARYVRSTWTKERTVSQWSDLFEQVLG